MRGPANTNQDSTQSHPKKHTFLKGLMPGEKQRQSIVLQEIMDLFQLCQVECCSLAENMTRNRLNI